MEFTISDKKKKDLFISVFHLLKNSSSQMNVIINPTEFHIQGMDKSHVCLFDLTLECSWFTSFTVDKKYEICLDSGNFYSMISAKSDEQNLVIKLVSEDTLSIELISLDKKGDYNKYFTLPLLEYDYEEMNIPDIEYDADISLPSKKMTDMLSQLSNFGDDLNIRCVETCVDFITKGTSGEMRVNIPCDDMIIYSVIEDEEVNLTYSLVYISKMCISNKVTADIDFSLSRDRPMKLNYNLGDNSYLMFHISPKITDDL